MENRWKQILGVTLVIFGIALGGFGITQLLLPAKYAATAKIQVENDVNDSMRSSSTLSVAFDPYFIQTTFEIIQSQLVLSNVVVGLKLNEVWGRKYFNGKTLTMEETVGILRSRMGLAPVRNTKLISITFYSDDPNEAAQVANEIAEGYRNYRIQIRSHYAAVGLRALQQQFHKEAQEIAVAQTNLDFLQKKLGSPSDASTNSTDQQSFWDAKHKLDELINSSKAIQLKIEAQETDSNIPKPPVVLLVDRAEPPTVPVAPNRTLGPVLCVIGFCSVLAGFFFLKAGREE